MEKNELYLKSRTFGEAIDKDGKVIKEFNKQTSNIFNVEEIENNKVGIDAMMMTHAILKSDFKFFLKSQMGKDFPYTTGICKKETIGNLVKLLKISYKKAKNKFSVFEKEINLKYLPYKPEYYDEANKFFNEVKKSMRIKNLRTFRKDCVNIIILKDNNISEFFSNDEELEKACKKFNKKINFVKIADSSEKVIKNWRQQTYFKKRYQKKGRRAKR